MKRFRLICVHLCSSVVAFSAFGCWTITPPPKASIKDPVPVFVADYGEHSSVLLPQSEGVYVEYLFGDWGYAVENNDNALGAVIALLFSPQSSLGRIITPMGPAEDHPATVRTPARLVRIDASREKVTKIAQELADRYENARTDPVYNPENQAFFVKDRTHYWLFNNCNHMTRTILRQLDCTSSGFVYISDFEVKEQK
jgi:hypothetical protein